MEVIPENQSGAIGASPLSPAAEQAIKGVNLVMPGERTEVTLDVDNPAHWAQNPGFTPDLSKWSTEGYKPSETIVDPATYLPTHGQKDDVDQEVTSDLCFGEAINRLKRGMAVARKGWNGKGMFVYHVPANAYPAQTGVAKQYFGENALVPYNEYLAIKNVDGTVSTWVASINDMMAQDWYVVNVNMLAAFRRNPPVATMEEDQVK